LGLKGDSDNRPNEGDKDLVLVFSRGEPKGVGEQLCALPCTKEKNERSVRRIVAQARSRDGGGPAERNSARKNVPLALNEQLQWLVAFQICVCSGWREQFRGEDKAQHAQGRCRGVDWDMPQVDAKVGARVQPVSEARTKKVVVTN
jgi:hypothetical protein